MALTKLNATAKLTMEPGLVVECASREFKFRIDMPEQAGGTNTSLNPVETLLNAFGACQSITAKVYAQAMGIDLEEFWVEVEGSIDMDGFRGVEGVKTGLQAIKSTIHIKSGSPEDKVREFIDTIEKICPVGDTLRSQFPMEYDVVTE